MRRRDKPTPHMSRTRAEGRIAELEQQLADAHAEIARLQQWETVEADQEGPFELEAGR